MAEDAVEVVLHRNAFYRDNYRKIVFTLLASILIIFGQCAVIFYIVTHPPEPRYFATTIDGRLRPLVPLDKSNLEQGALLQWATQAAVAAYTYNFVNYQGELQAASAFFTPEGWQAFLKALKDSNNLDAVIAKKLVVSAVPQGAPIILQEGILNNLYSWRVRLPLLVTYQSAAQVTQQQVTVTILITRMSIFNSPKGIGIAQFVVTGGESLS